MKNILFIAGALVVALACNKNDGIERGNETLVGGWKSDSSVYKGYSGSRLVMEDVDRHDGSEEETMYFFEEGTFKYYYVSLEMPGVRDTIETTTGTYTFDAEAKELILKNATNFETCSVLSLSSEKLVYNTVIDNPANPEPGIDKEIISFHLSRLPKM